MSRYTKTIDEGKVVLAWGYDSPMSEYFFQAINTEAEEDEDDIIFSISSYHTLKPHPDYPNRMKWSNSEILELMETKYKNHIPAVHRAALAGDLMF